MTASKFTFITKNDGENDETIFAIESNNFETLNVSDTYDRNGQQVSAQDAGDSVEILSNFAAIIANDKHNEDNEEDEYENKFVVGSSFSAFDHSDIFDALTTNILKKGVDVNFNKSTVKGMIYWDGHNWKTITIECDFDEPTHNVIEDAKLIEELNSAIKNREFLENGFGTKKYICGKIEIVNNYCQGSFSAYEITID